MRSVLLNWVMELPLREQGVLLTCIRGCDVVPKLPLDSTPRQLTAYLRFLVMVPHDERETGIPGAFFQSEPPHNWKASELGHLPQHWYSHIMHGFEIIAYRHEHLFVKEKCKKIYLRLVDSLHLQPEREWEMIERLSEDRILKNNVVS